MKNLRCVKCGETGLELNGNRRCAACEIEVNEWVHTKEVEGKRGPAIDTLIDYHLPAAFVQDLIGVLTYE